MGEGIFFALQVHGPITGGGGGGWAGSCKQGNLWRQFTVGTGILKF